MAASVKIDFQPFGAPAGGDLVVFVGDDLKPADAALEIEPRIKDAIAGAAGPERFKGKPATALTIPAPAGLSAERLIAVGIGGENDRGKLVYADLGAAVAGKLAGRSGAVVAALPGLAPSGTAPSSTGESVRSPAPASHRKPLVTRYEAENIRSAAKSTASTFWITFSPENQSSVLRMAHSLHITVAETSGNRPTPA